MNSNNRIAPDALIHPGCRIENSSIGPGCEIGSEGPVVLKNCQLARRVTLSGGSFSGAVFRDGARMGLGAQVRAGTILEEQANGAHTVGLKQTVLLPFVTLGSLINFCDVLMAGGTSRRDHSEVGSSYIHFNYTPNQDKATASLIGDVPRGVLLGERPIFLGGQGGLVGPSRIAYGSVIAAGSICRQDLIEENQLFCPAPLPERTVRFVPGRYGNLARTVRNCFAYVGNVKALKAWCEQVRVRFIRDEYDRAVHEGALANLDQVLCERIRRMQQLAERSGGDFLKRWPHLREQLEQPLDTLASASLMAGIEAADASDYIVAIQGLDRGARCGASAWLQSIVDETLNIEG